MRAAIFTAHGAGARGPSKRGFRSNRLALAVAALRSSFLAFASTASLSEQKRAEKLCVKRGRISLRVNRVTTVAELTPPWRTK